MEAGASEGDPSGAPDATRARGSAPHPFAAGATAAAPPILVRTVLDLRPRTDRYLRQVALLAASWHRHARGGSRLQVLTIGAPDAALAALMARLGVEHACIAPGANDDFSRNGNKIQGCGPDPRGGRVLLVDNDTCFLGDLRDLQRVRPDAIAAAEPGGARVSDAEWQLVRDGLGMPLLRQVWAPLNDRVRGAGATLPGERWLYLNSGVILFPAGLDHRQRWASAQRAIRDHFAGGAHASAAVTTSDQAGFAASVAAHGAFAWLPARFNYRPPGFCLGLEPAERIRILHFTGDVDDGQACGIGDALERYWRQRVLARLDRLPPSVAGAERRWRREQAMHAFAMVRAIVDAYELDDWRPSVAASRPAEATA